MSIEGYILDCDNSNSANNASKYLRKQVNNLVYEYEEDICSLFVRGDVVSSDTETYINNFIDFLENNNMCFMGMFGE
jgi:hypothetical protein